MARAIDKEVCQLSCGVTKDMNCLWLRYKDYVNSVAGSWFARYHAFLPSRDDVMQEAAIAFLKAINSVDDQRSEGEVRVFLRKAIMNHLVSVFLRKQSHEELDDSAGHDTPENSDPLSIVCIEEILTDAVSSLSERHQKALMRVLDGEQKAYQDNEAHYAWRVFREKAFAH